MRHAFLTFVLICTGVLVGVSSIGAVYMLNERRDDQMRLIQRTEAWARYETAVDACDRGNVLRARINSLTDAKRGDLIPTVNCQTAIPNHRSHHRRETYAAVHARHRPDHRRDRRGPRVHRPTLRRHH